MKEKEKTQNIMLSVLCFTLLSPLDSLFLSGFVYHFKCFVCICYVMESNCFVWSCHCFTILKKFLLYCFCCCNVSLCCVCYFVLFFFKLSTLNVSHWPKLRLLTYESLIICRMNMDWCVRVYSYVFVSI